MGFISLTDLAECSDSFCYSDNEMTQEYDSDSFLYEEQTNPKSSPEDEIKPELLTTDSPKPCTEPSTSTKIGELRLTLVNNMLAKTKVIYFNQTFYVYDSNGGFFEETSEDKLNFLIEAEFNNPTYNSLYFSKEAIAELKRIAFCDSDFAFNPDDTLINFADAVYDISTGETHCHRPEYYFNYFIPADILCGYTEAPNFHEFINVLCEGEKLKIKRLQEFIGVLLSPLQPKCAFFLIGADNCGKTTLTNFVEELIGEDFVSAVTLDAFDRPFELSEIYGKRLNVCDELADDYNARVWSIFKKISGDGKVSINRKHLKVFSCHPKVKLLFTGNKLPILPNDKALIDRIQVIFFNHTIPRSQRDPSLKEKLRKERDGIVRWALKGLRRFIENGQQFTECSDAEILNSKFCTSDSLRIFIETHLEYCENNKICTSEIYKSYHNFCGENHVPLGKRSSDKAIKSAIRRHFPDAVETKLETRQAFQHLKLI